MRTFFKVKLGLEISKSVREPSTGFGGCLAGLTYAGPSASGDLLPCVPAPIKLDNLLEHNLEEIWVDDALLNHIRDRKALKGSCRTRTSMVFVAVADTQCIWPMATGLNLTPLALSPQKP
jgi:MoaA/NifB/PqqE/SkfB family radical SAM enzyme